jgi:Ni/Co efflux regulator RcnB
MKLSTLITAAALCLASSAAFAHPHHGHDRYYGGYEHHHWRGHHDYRPYRYEPRRFYDNRYVIGVGPYHNIYAGQPLPRPYWHRMHRVGHWHRYALPRPPYGHDWVRIGNDFVLVHARSGMIVSIVLR